MISSSKPSDPHDILIEVETQYISQQSQPQEKKFMFAYTINIKNNSQHRCQLISRHWIITDGNFTTQEVHGEGVVGQQPLLDPGQSFEYTSAAVLKTEVGVMKGFYDMINEQGDVFQTAIPQFTLSIPRAIH